MANIKTPKTSGRKAKPSFAKNNKQQKRVKKEIAANKIAEKKLAEIPAELSCPDRLQGMARDEWFRIRELWSHTELRFLNDCDANTLECYCDAFEKYQCAKQKWIDLQKAVVVDTSTEKGKITQNALDIINKDMLKWGAAIANYGSRLCLDVLSRERLAIANGKFTKGNNALLEFLKED